MYFLGATPQVLGRCVDTIQHAHPKLVVAGMHDGYFDEDERVAADVAASGARVLFVGISSPRKEVFLSEQSLRIGPVFAMGVGGSFDVIAGMTRRAPLWMQRAGLEWLYRLAQEPGRMWRRYLVGNARFVGLVMREWRVTRRRCRR